MELYFLLKIRKAIPKGRLKNFQTTFYFPLSP